MSAGSLRRATDDAHRVVGDALIELHQSVVILERLRDRLALANRMHDGGVTELPDTAPPRSEGLTMTNNVAAAKRVVETIRAFKWIVVILLVLIGAALIKAINEATSAPDWTAWLTLVVAVGTLLAAVVTWVLFGWFEHTLGMLVVIANRPDE